MRALGAVASVSMLAAGAAQARQALGVHRGWAAFRDAAPTRCYALAAPGVRQGGAFAAVGHWPERRIGGQLHLRFARPARPGSAILLTIDERSFQLAGRGPDAWAATLAADRAIVAAMRTGVAMTARTVDAAGVTLVDEYALGGAATAIDAAALACAPR